MKPKHSSARVQIENNTTRIIALGLLAVTLLLSLVGCKSQSRSIADINPAGTYTLVSVDGKDVPCETKHNGATMTLKSGVFTINSDGTCRSLMTFSLPPHKEINREVKATYIRKGAELTMRWEHLGVTRGNIAADTFTMNNEGMVFIFRK